MYLIYGCVRKYKFFLLNFSVIWTKYLPFGAVTTIYYQQRMSSTNWTHLLSSGSHNYLNSPGCPFRVTVGMKLEYSAWPYLKIWMWNKPSLKLVKWLFSFLMQIWSQSHLALFKPTVKTLRTSMLAKRDEASGSCFEFSMMALI